MTTEIERRFLPNVDVCKRFIIPDSRTEILEGYPLFPFGNRNFPRVRKTINPDKTILFERWEKDKFKQSLFHEIEWAEEEILTDSLFKNCDNNRLMKFCSSMDWANRPKWLILKINHFQDIQGKLSELFILELKLNISPKSQIIELPDWFGKEITNNERWSDYRLCIEGEPDASY